MAANFAKSCGYFAARKSRSAHRYFQPRGWSHLCFFPSHRRLGSHVPYKSLILSFAPPTCRMPLEPSQASPKLISEDGSAPDFGIV